MSQFHDHETGQQLRCACTNVIGFWQLLHCEHTTSGKPICPIKRMAWRAHLTGCAANLAEFVIKHDRDIARGFLEDPRRMPEIIGKALGIRAIVNVGERLEIEDQLEDCASKFAIQLLGALKCK
ncbi:hypothetical protein [Labrenzia sp. PHM005]|uniref:hypothetical protein n=1 Tax=Labrenzia sp. PHM005 TaxID=2590016 RepID=UPI0011406B9C|nr:hypothetical protein [Labrenzia sp. PHM005]QDG74393.1 hypothetical protein FJ695_00065 [Labrenzia sp. PHM005]